MNWTGYLDNGKLNSPIINLGVTPAGKCDFLPVKWIKEGGEASVRWLKGSWEVLINAIHTLYLDIFGRNPEEISNFLRDPSQFGPVIHRLGNDLAERVTHDRIPGFNAAKVNTLITDLRKYPSQNVPRDFTSNETLGTINNFLISLPQTLLSAQNILDNVYLPMRYRTRDEQVHFTNDYVKSLPAHKQAIVKDLCKAVSDVRAHAANTRIDPARLAPLFAQGLLRIQDLDNDSKNQLIDFCELLFMAYERFGRN